MTIALVDTPRPGRTGILAWPMATLREQRGDLFNQAGARKNRGRLDPSVFSL
ncbi:MULTISPECIES: hypothetical protein [unclassified Moorena]|uniref:hypothetical protein n=1 Tax=unclassified Moorena TaxID=2683338 RepID=UPI0002EDFC91|nr:MULTISPECIES: hypothetical protein [unclassified Moorena]NER87195.1 hypothetical protein [Moorena sp. SIO3A2]